MGREAEHRPLPAGTLTFPLTDVGVKLVNPAALVDVTR
jgi:hypothetical protein